MEPNAIAVQRLGTGTAKSTDRKQNTGTDTRKGNNNERHQTGRSGSYPTGTTFTSKKEIMIQIYNDNGFYNFSEGTLIPSTELTNIAKDIGSVWDALEPGENLSLSDGDFRLSEDLDLVAVAAGS